MKYALSLYMAQLLANKELKMYFKGDKNDGSYGHGIPDDPQKVIPKGCQIYTIKGIRVIAISEKSARRKVEKNYQQKKLWKQYLK